MSPFMYGMAARLAGVALALWMAYVAGSQLLAMASVVAPAMAG